MVKDGVCLVLRVSEYFFYPDASLRDELEHPVRV